ncbi:MAG: 30S ribosomal protein S16 [Planctomycetota bacterium]
MVRLRFKRFGRTHAPVYRLCAMDKRSPRDGQAIEELGQYDPCNADADRQFNVNEERVRHWLSTGAQPSDTVKDLLIKAGIVDKKTGKQTPASA